MEYRRFESTYVIRLDPGEDIVEQVQAIARQEGIQLATVQGLGAVNDFTVGVFDTVSKQYHANHFQGSYEIVSLTGTITTMSGDVYCHLHMSAGDAQGHVVGGHLNRAVISATGELVVTAIPGTVDRKFSRRSSPPRPAVRSGSGPCGTRRRRCDAPAPPRAPGRYPPGRCTSRW